MKLLLTKSINHLGIVGDIVDVKAGYARNYLLPRNLAAEPTAANVRRLAEARKVAEQERAKLRLEMEAAIHRIEGLEVSVHARANEDGALYGSVGRKEISAALAAEGHYVAVDQIALPSPIRRLDTVPVEIRLATDLRATIKVWVVREKTTEESAEGEKEASDSEATGMEAGTHDGDRSE